MPEGVFAKPDNPMTHSERRPPCMGAVWIRRLLADTGHWPGLADIQGDGVYAFELYTVVLI